MDPIVLGVAILGVMFALMALHVPIGFAMAFAGFLGTGFLLGWKPAVTLFGSVPTELMTNNELATIPMFLAMGSLAGASGMSTDLYRLFNAFVGHYRGGLAIATVGGCGGFAAVCGSSVATAATFMRIAYPEMKRQGYSDELATGCIAAGGTLGILIPPSVLLILYALLTEQFILALFVAGIFPGLLAILLYVSAVLLHTRLRPEAGPAAQRVRWSGRIAVLRQAWRVLVLVAVVSGGIYGGFFTVNEAAAVGVCLAFVFGIPRGILRLAVLRGVLAETASTTVMIFVIIIGATIFSKFIALTQLPETLVREIMALGLSTWLVVLVLLAMYLVLGCIFDSVAAMVITLPVVFPLIVGLGFDPVWWGIINIMVIEIGMITPPIGINVFVIQGMAPQIPMRTIFAGVTWFFVSDLVRLAAVTIWPQISLWLPAALGVLHR